MTCVIYARISDDRAGDGKKVSEQIRLCREKAEQLGLTVLRVYREDGVSATQRRPRPAFEQMLKDAPRSIVVWHQDRLLRTMKDLLKIIDLGAVVHAVQSDSFDLTTPTGRLIAKTLASIAEFEGDHKAERIKLKYALRASEGYWQFSQRPFGYEAVKEIDDATGKPVRVVKQVPHEVEALREGYALLLEGLSYYELARWWNGEEISGDVQQRQAAAKSMVASGAQQPGAKSAERDPALGARGGGVPRLWGQKRPGGAVPTVSGKPWTLARVSNMMANPRYAGIVTMNGEEVELLEGCTPQWEPAISTAVWEQFRQKRLLSKVPRTWATSPRHLLSGLMTCGGCGGSLTAMNRRYRVRDPETKKVVEDMNRPKYVHYGCTKGYCTGIRGEYADEYVGAVVVQLIDDPRIRQALVEVPDTEPVETELMELQQKAEVLREMRVDGALTRAELNDRIAPVLAQVDRLQRRLGAMRADSPVADLALADSIQERWERLTVLQKRRVITELGLEVTVLRDQRGKAPLGEDGKPVPPEERAWARIVVERPEPEGNDEA